MSNVYHGISAVAADPGSNKNVFYYIYGSRHRPFHHHRPIYILTNCITFAIVPGTHPFQFLEMPQLQYHNFGVVTAITPGQYLLIIMRVKYMYVMEITFIALG